MPLVLQKQNVAEIISDKLQMYLPKGMPNIDDWENLCRRLDGVEHKVGKYTRGTDAGDGRGGRTCPSHYKIIIIVSSSSSS